MSDHVHAKHYRSVAGNLCCGVCFQVLEEADPRPRGVCPECWEVLTSTREELVHASCVRIWARHE